MVDRIWRTLSSLKNNSSTSQQSMAMSESNPFADPDSLLQFSEYDADNEGDDLSVNSGSRTLTNHTKNGFSTPQAARRREEAETLLGRSNSEKMSKSNKVEGLNGFIDGATPSNSNKNVTSDAGGRRKPSRSALTNQASVTSMASDATDGGRRPISRGKKSIMSFEKSKPSMYFDDGVRQVDYVLAYEDDGDDDDTDDESNFGDDPSSVIDAELASDAGKTQQKKKASERKSDRRRIYEENLEKLGLEIERHESLRMGVKFVLIHAPFKVLCKQAELMKIKMPVYQNDSRKSPTLMEGVLNKYLKRIKFLDFKEKIRKRMVLQEFFSQPFVEEHLDCFSNHQDPQNFFPRAERSRMVYDFLIRTRYDKSNSDKFRAGMDRLLKNGTYSAAYPLHEDIEYGSDVQFETCSNRQLLYECWVKMKNFYKYQPLDLLQHYFGTKIGLYFAWLGHYTRSLYPISIIGVICFIYGLATVEADGPSSDICASDGAGQILICPSCNQHCDYIQLNGSCIYAKLTYVFDNTATIFFAALMSIWVTFYLEAWKRYHAEIAYKWNVHDMEQEDEVMRPEFQFRIKKLKVNPATQNPEPYLPTTEKCWRIAGSGVTVVFFLCLVIALVIGVIVYRAIVLQLFYGVKGMDRTQAMIITSTSAAVINLVFILIMNHFYNLLAFKLTDWECPRTQTEFENSYTLKVFLFQFINFYSSLFYIAFIKGRLSGAPGTHYNANDEKQIDPYRMEECDPAGCMFELVVQLLIIMCGKQFFNGFMEIIFPVLTNCFRRWHLRLPESKKEKKKRKKQEKQQDVVDTNSDSLTFCERDYALNPTNDQVLFEEYLEMVIQFGFVTLFVAAFPLAPLFALINNVLEIRLDAYKFLVTARKPVPVQAKNIGVWMTILDILSNMAVICNAFVIAFTSDFIPKVYYYYNNGGHSMDHYVEYSLSYFNSTGYVGNSTYGNVTLCRYRDYRLPPCGLTDPPSEQCDDSNGYSADYWIILTYRLIFVIVFEHVVLTCKSLFAYIIPDVPTRIAVQVQRERYLARQAILQRQAIIADEVDKPYLSEDSKPADNEEVAIQPNKRYDGSDETPPPELAKIVARMSRRPSQNSKSSQATEQNTTLTGPRFRAIINRAAHSRDYPDNEIDQIIGNQPRNADSMDSFHTAQGSNNTVNNAGK